MESAGQHWGLMVALSKRHVVERAEFVVFRSASILIQSCYRMKLAQTLYSRQRKAVCLIQSAVRMKLRRLHIQKMSQAATRISRQWRTYRQSRIQTNAAVVIQANVRRWLEQSKYKETRVAALRLQSFVKVPNLVLRKPQCL